MPIWLWLPALIVAIIMVVALAILLRPRGVRVAFAKSQFEREREAVQAQFFDAASRSGKPRGLRWLRCEWEPAVEFARDRRNGQLIALAPVTISFEAIPGSDMEGLPAVGNLRNASAVFAFDGLHWMTNGRAVFNLNPDEAIQHFAGQYERVS
jgi:hypothetical protein